MDVRVKTERSRERGDCLGQTNDPTKDPCPSRKDTAIEGNRLEQAKDSVDKPNGFYPKTTGSPRDMNTNINLRSIKKENIEEDEQPVDSNHSNRRRSLISGDADAHSNNSDIYEDEASLKERFVDGEITVVQIPSTLDSQVSSPEGEKVIRRDMTDIRHSQDIDQYPYRVPIVYPMQAHPSDSGSPSPNGYRLDERDGRSSPILRRKYYDDPYWRSESPQRSEIVEGTYPSTSPSSLYHGLYSKGAPTEGDNRNDNPYSRFTPEVSKGKRTDGFRRDMRRDRVNSRDDDKEEESLWKQVQRYRHRKRPALGKLPTHSQEETIFMQYNEIRERRLREGRYVPRTICKGAGSGEKEEEELPPSPSSQSGGESRKTTSGSKDHAPSAHAHISEPTVTSSNPLMSGTGDKSEEFYDDVPSMCNGDLGLSVTQDTSKSREAIDSRVPLEVKESSKTYFARRTSNTESLTEISERKQAEPSQGSDMGNSTNTHSPTYTEFPATTDPRRYPRADRNIGIRDQEYRHGGMADYRHPLSESRHYHPSLNGCGDYSERFGMDDYCHDYGDRRRGACHHHCCYPMEARSNRKRRRSNEPDDFWVESAQDKIRKTGTGMEGTRDGHARSPTQNDTHSYSPASSDSRDVEATSESENHRDSRESRGGPEDHHIENGCSSRNSPLNEMPEHFPTERIPKQGTCSSEETPKELREDDVVCQVNGLFSLPGYRETKYNITLGELKRRISSPETLTRVEMISYVRQAKTSGRILLDKNGIATSNRSHPSIMSRVCEREAQVLACGLHKMNVEYLPVRKMVQKCVGMYKSRGCDGCQDCRLRLRRRIIDVEITRNMLKELLRVTQESSFDGILDTFDLASHTFGVPNLMNNIKLIDEYFKLLLLALENE